MRCIIKSLKLINMKKKIYFVLAAFILAFTAPTFANDAKPTRTSLMEIRLQQIESRVLEIKAMDKSDLGRTERKALRQELVSLKKEAAPMNGGVYLSVGAIIIIILLLILIL